MCWIPRQYRTLLDARYALLRGWRRGDWRFGHTEYCAQHGAFHLMRGVGRG